MHGDEQLAERFVAAALFRSFIAATRAVKNANKTMAQMAQPAEVTEV